jgi:hypothetical protein
MGRNDLIEADVCCPESHLLNAIDTILEFFINLPKSIFLEEEKILI